MSEKIQKNISFSLLLLLILPALTFSEENHVFERMWPTLHQPWYFDRPIGIATDTQGNIYISDTWNDRIQKFTANGEFVTNWKLENSMFYKPSGIAIDGNGDVYVAAGGGGNHIQKFTSDGTFIKKWGHQGSGDGGFILIGNIAVDFAGNNYVSDRHDNRIQKFDADGKFIATWGTYGSMDGQFRAPEGIAIDEDGNIYVADSENNRIQKFTSDGAFVAKWGTAGTEDGQFDLPKGIAADGNGFVYVADTDNNRIQKFDRDGRFLLKLGSGGFEEGQLSHPLDIAVDQNGNLWVTDYNNDRIVRFDSEGNFISRWEASGSGNGEFRVPKGMILDASGNLYVADRGNRRIQKFDPEGRFITAWRDAGSAGKIQFPVGIAVGGDGYLYIVDDIYRRVWKFTPDGDYIDYWSISISTCFTPQAIAIDANDSVYISCGTTLTTEDDNIAKYTKDGNFLTKWGRKGSGDGEFMAPRGLAIDQDGNIYVADSENDRIQKFTSEGEYVTKWGQSGSGDGQFNRPSDVSIDESGNIYVVDTDNDRIQKFTSNWAFITSWGATGNYPEQMRRPYAIVTTPTGDVYATESSNHRVQVFRRISVEAKNKAIIIAGGGLYPGNNLWNATQMCAHFAYRTLIHQGFTRETIHFLTSDMDLDLDNNGELDDVDGDATNSNLEESITNWASDADSLILYLVDHGGANTFRMSGNQSLNASDLDTWVDQLQLMISGKVIVIYDACESGSFLASLAPPSSIERIVITSTSPGESAYFVTQGSVSFSNFFWTHIFNGVNVKDAFELSTEAIGFTTDFQNPLLDANGNGTGNEAEDLSLVQGLYIGNGTQIHGSGPQIGIVSPHQTINATNSAQLFADNVTDDDGIARVWAVIRPPDFSQGSSDNPVQELPSIDLVHAENDRYEATYNNFSKEGTYHIGIYALDRIGNTSIPKLTSVSVNNPLRRKAILVVGGEQSSFIWPAVEQNVKLCYEALSFQGYTDDDVYLLSPASIPGVTKLPVLSTISNFEYAMNSWAVGDTQDVVLYLIGNGNYSSFQINSSETLSASILDNWLDNLQYSIPGKITVIYDACQSGSFISYLKPSQDKERILLASSSSNQPACFLLDGDISFSKYFWSQVANGANVRDAFLHAKQAIEFTTSMLPGGAVVAQLDDNGNGIGNEKEDGQLARNYTIGVGIILAGDDPLIGSISPQQTVSLGGSATLWADEVTTTGTVDRVWAVITPPGFSTAHPSDPLIDLPSVELTHTTGNRYEGSYNGFTDKGIYRITVYAIDTEGAISLPKETLVCVEECSDDYEDDDSFDTAGVIVINAPSAQNHNFHDSGDQDWVKFYGLTGQTYTLAVQNAGSSCDAVIEVYDTDGSSLLQDRDDTGAGEDEELAWVCPADGIYFVKIRQFDSAVFGEDTDYELKVYHPIGPLPGFIRGVITDSLTLQVIGDVRLKTNSNQTALSLSDGNYLMVHPAGTYSMTAEKAGYTLKEIEDVEISDGTETSLDIVMDPIDTDNDGISDLVENASECLNAADDDTDDDGILDGNEDKNHDGVVDAGETDPCDIDSDGDGLQDGTEIGLTAPQGADTDMGVFIPDADPNTTTDPLDADSDDDGLLDGEEDGNHNGRVDPGEKDPNHFEVRCLQHLLLLLL